MMFAVAAQLAFRQLTHRGAKLLGALVGVCVAVILIFTQVGFQNALYDSAVGIPNALDADVLIAGPTFHSWADSPPWMARSLLYEAEGVAGVSRVTPLYTTAIQVASPVDGHSLSAYLMAFPPGAPAFTRADINRQIGSVALADRVLMDGESRDDFEAIRADFEKTGLTEIAVLNPSESLQKVVEVVGLFGVGPSFSIDGSIITSDLNFYRMTNIPLDRVGLGLVRAAPGIDSKALRAAIQGKLGTRAQVYTRAEFAANEVRYYADETPIGYIFRMGLVVGVLVGTVFISQALHGIVNDNIKEYATLRAMGYDQSFFVALVAVISLTLSVCSYIPSTLVAWGIYHLAASATKLPLQMKLGDMTTILAVVIAMGLAATMLAIRKLKAADPVDLFS